jgi:hypothetical protein
VRVFLDFEASSLAKDSYPVEVAWVFEDGLSESHLIQPLPRWTDWDEAAARIHGITRADLSRGMPVVELGRRMLETLGPHTLYASSPSWDGKWLSVLLRGAGLPRHALRLGDTDALQVEAASEILARYVPDDALGPAVAELVENVRRAATGPVLHRALPDAEQERRLWLAVREAARQAADRLSRP